MTNIAPMTSTRRARSGAAAFALAVLFGSLAAAPALAQNPFSAAVEINDSVVTHYEIGQRALFLEVVRAPGDLMEQALEILVNERLQVQEARRMGVVASPEAIENGVEEFAARADLGPEQFLRTIGEEGVEPETFRDFVANGISWRNVVQARFTAVARLTEAEAAEALPLLPQLGNARILVAEIVVPVTPENQDNLRSELARLGQDVDGSTEAFSEAARRFSAASTREDDGLAGWRALDEIPGTLREEFLLLSTGEVYGPVNLGPAMALFQMRGLSDGPYRAPATTAIEYATVPLPGLGGAETEAAAAQLRADLDTCDDLYGERAAGTFEILEQPVGAVPNDIAMALAALDPGEMSFAVRRPAADGTGFVTVAVMMCNRVVAEPEGGIEAVRQQLFNQRLQDYADGLLEELRADAIITYNP